MKVNGIREELVDGDPSVSTVSALLCLSGPLPLISQLAAEGQRSERKRVEGGRAGLV